MRYMNSRMSAHVRELYQMQVRAHSEFHLSGSNRLDLHRTNHEKTTRDVTEAFRDSGPERDAEQKDCPHTFARERCTYVAFAQFVVSGPRSLSFTSCPAMYLDRNPRTASVLSLTLAAVCRLSLLSPTTPSMLFSVSTTAAARSISWRRREEIISSL